MQKALLDVQNINKIEQVAEFVAESILKQLKLGKRVLFFLTGGSSISVGVKIGEILKNEDLHNLTITLTDERYGKLNHPDSNEAQLINKGFDLSQIKFVPVLIGEDKKLTAQKFNETLEKELKLVDYKIGIFGIGTDFHTAGILPESVATLSTDFACGYDTIQFSRITITFKTIECLDEVIVFMQGKEKEIILEELKKDINLEKEPAQVLKRVPLLKIFYKKDI